MKYETLIIDDPLTGISKHFTLFTDDGAISFVEDENNPYYQDYLKWLDEQ